MKRVITLFLLALSFGFVFHSCIKEGDFDFGPPQIDGNLTYDLVAPLVDAHLLMNDLLKSVQFIRPDAEGLLQMIYEDDFDYTVSSQLISIPNQLYNLSLPYKVTIPADSLMAVDSILIPTNKDVSFDLPMGLRIDSMLLKTGNLALNLNTEIRNKCVFEVVSSAIVDTMGRPLRILHTFQGVSSGSQYAQLNIDMRGYRLDLRSVGSHKIPFKVNIIIYRDKRNVVTYEAGANFWVNLTSLSPKTVYGYFGTMSIGPFLDELRLPIFDRFPMESLRVEKAFMKIQVSNGVGLPLYLDSKLQAHTANPNYPQKALEVKTDLPFPRHPSETPPEITFTESFQELINDNEGFMPSKLSYSVRMEANRNGDISQPNFLSDSSSIRIAIRAEVPLRLHFEGLKVIDTIRFNGIPAAEAIHYFKLKANIHNAFPLDAEVDMLLLDENKRPIDSVFIDALRGGTVDATTGHVRSPSVNQIEIDLNRSQIEHLVDTRYFVIRGKLRTSASDKGLVSIYENNENEGFLKVMMGARVKANAGIILKFSQK